MKYKYGRFMQSKHLCKSCVRYKYCQLFLSSVSIPGFHRKVALPCCLYDLNTVLHSRESTYFELIFGAVLDPGDAVCLHHGAMPLIDYWILQIKVQSALLAVRVNILVK